MGMEIERKFLLSTDAWRKEVVHRESLAQGYLIGARALREGSARASVRVRLAGAKAWLNVKSAQLGIARAEYEVALPAEDARAMLDTLCDGVLEKVRHHVWVDGHLFEIDEFLGDNAGLVVAELELEAIDADFPRPSWLGREVSALPRYFNVNLIDHPYARWSADECAALDGVPA